MGRMNLERDLTVLDERLTEAEGKLRSIRELAMNQVFVGGTTEKRLMDAEIRLRRIHALATDA